MKVTMKAMTECHSCEYRRLVPGNSHIQCANPDPGMRGDSHGIRMGWFFYPLLFDPTWKLVECANYKSKGEKP